MKIHSFANKYGFLINLYLQMLGLIGTSYQIMNEYHHASNYFKKIDEAITHYSHELTDRLTYLLAINGVNTDNGLPLQSIIENIRNRKYSVENLTT